MGSRAGEELDRPDVGRRDQPIVGIASGVDSLAITRLGPTLSPILWTSMQSNRPIVRLSRESRSFSICASALGACKAVKTLLTGLRIGPTE